MVFLVGCGSSHESSEEVNKPEGVYIVSGQSNSLRCGFDRFERLVGKVVKIGRAGTHLDLHIDLYDFPELKGINAKGVIFINGAADGKIETYPPYYVERMNYYRSLIHKDVGKKLPFYISNIGYNTDYPDKPFDDLRKEINQQDDWIIAYDGAQYFRDEGLLVDASHYSEEGCRLVTDAIIEAVLEGA